ncbi:DUF4436 domain-containing protein [Mycobacterium kiyosense]|uniref:DUF4436 domain-containing protein n=3 Tax=Mycobacteriaceae TaxID=1762 RepID=A0A9P3Q914_9MYCO|nr:DUF4436 domain-containing protein [Mycobacterium kiyosense]BDE12411.1 DUF4436 domain-containing protein [Mycobacterium sp. 20KCMC460]GLB84081.1 DUF4436 domain-containing protein [Mycobacterium kiyosense]GLB89855.1 DUF4436 domain-containing protein [Mycobacterium kiyosense]GLB98262.1 DUF4436 domain-containing protein [Mycobacterium kiyosense]
MTVQRDLALSAELSDTLALPARSPQQSPVEAPPRRSAAESKRRRRRRHLAFDICMVIGVALVYLLSLFGYHWLATTPGPLPDPDVSTADNSVVLVRIEQLHPAEHRLDVKVLVMPDDSMIDKRLNVLTTDTSVRFFPQNDLGDLQYPVGKSPAQVATTIPAHGDPGDWPFDGYKTDTIQADVLVGTGEGRQYKPARVEVTGVLEGWDVTATRVGRDSHDPNRPDNVIITIKRAKGPLVFDLGICLVLIALPTLALFVAIQMASGRRKFLPPFSTWYAAMLFAVVPLRNILPGSPPPGSWVDQAVVIWVLIGLATALVLYIVAWHRQGD